MKTTIKFLICASSAIILTGCNKSFQDSQLIGSWKLDNPAADARFTYYPNHAWVMTVVASDNQLPSGSESGEWKLEGKRINVMTELTFGGASTNVSEMAEIVKLNADELIEKLHDVGGRVTTSVFHKIDSPSALPSDAELTQNIIGTWQYSYTNADKLTGALIYINYKPDGSASWSGVISKGSQSMQVPTATGLWRVNEKHLVTTITNSKSNLFPMNKEYRDEIILVTGLEFTYRNGQDAVKKVLRVKTVN